MKKKGNVMMGVMTTTMIQLKILLINLVMMKMKQSQLLLKKVNRIKKIRKIKKMMTNGQMMIVKKLSY